MDDDVYTKIEAFGPRATCQKCGGEERAAILWHDASPFCVLDGPIDMQFGYPFKLLSLELNKVELLRLQGPHQAFGDLRTDIMQMAYETADRLRKSGRFKIGQHLDVKCTCGYAWRSPIFGHVGVDLGVIGMSAGNT